MSRILRGSAARGRDARGRNARGRGSIVDPIVQKYLDILALGPAVLFAMEGEALTEWNGTPIYYADAAGTIPVFSAGDPVGGMLDLVSETVLATQTVDGDRPILGVDRVVFPGTGQSLETVSHVPVTREFTAILGATYFEGETLDPFYMTSANYRLQNNTGRNLRIRSGGFLASGGQYENGVRGVFTMQILASPDARYRVNSGPWFSGNNYTETPTTTPLSVGGNSAGASTRVDYTQFIVFDSVLSDTDAATVEGLLS